MPSGPITLAIERSSTTGGAGGAAHSGKPEAEGAPVTVIPSYEAEPTEPRLGPGGGEGAWLCGSRVIRYSISRTIPDVLAWGENAELRLATGGQRQLSGLRFDGRGVHRPVPPGGRGGIELLLRGCDSFHEAGVQGQLDRVGVEAEAARGPGFEGLDDEGLGVGLDGDHLRAQEIAALPGQGVGEILEAAAREFELDPLVPDRESVGSGRYTIVLRQLRGHETVGGRRSLDQDGAILLEGLPRRGRREDILVGRLRDARVEGILEIIEVLGSLPQGPEALVEVEPDGLLRLEGFDFVGFGVARNALHLHETFYEFLGAVFICGSSRNGDVRHNRLEG